MLGSIWGSQCLGKLSQVSQVSGFGSKAGGLGVGPKKFEDQRMCFGGCAYTLNSKQLIYLLCSPMLADPKPQKCG